VLNKVGAFEIPTLNVAKGATFKDGAARR
jgi:hypothetical protein